MALMPVCLAVYDACVYCITAQNTLRIPIQLVAELAISFEARRIYRTTLAQAKEDIEENSPSNVTFELKPGNTVL